MLFSSHKIIKVLIDLAVAVGHLLGLQLQGCVLQGVGGVLALGGEKLCVGQGIVHIEKLFVCHVLKITSGEVSPQIGKIMLK
jgi:hypothetical protein